MTIIIFGFAIFMILVALLPSIIVRNLFYTIFSMAYKLLVLSIVLFSPENTAPAIGAVCVFSVFEFIILVVTACVGQDDFFVNWKHYHA